MCDEHTHSSFYLLMLHLTEAGPVSRCCPDVGLAPQDNWLFLVVYHHPHTLPPPLLHPQRAYNVLPICNVIRINANAPLREHVSMVSACLVMYMPEGRQDEDMDVCYHINRCGISWIPTPRDIKLPANQCPRAPA